MSHSLPCIVTAKVPHVPVFMNIWEQWSIALGSVFYRDGKKRHLWIVFSVNWKFNCTCAIIFHFFDILSWKCKYKWGLDWTLVLLISHFYLCPTEPAYSTGTWILWLVVYWFYSDPLEAVGSDKWLLSMPIGKNQLPAVLTVRWFCRLCDSVSMNIKNKPHRFVLWNV